MALRYEYSWDVASLADPGIAIKVQDDGGTDELIYTSGLFTHSDISSVDSAYSDFATQLQTDLNDAAKAPALTGTYTVTWNGTTGYTVSVSGSSILNLIFSSTSTVAYGTNMRRLLGFSANQVSATSYSSNARPYYLIIPASQGRTNYTRDREQPEIVQEALGDDGSSVHISKATSRKVGDWMQVAEIEAVPAVFSAAGTPTHADMVDAGTSANDVPWSWEHSFIHCRTAQHRISVFEGSDHEVWELRADGMWFDPQRWTGQDLPLWQIPMKCRLIGRV